MAEIAEIAKRYPVRTVRGDNYSRGWVAQAFQRHGPRYDADHDLDKTAAYLEIKPSSRSWRRAAIVISITLRIPGSWSTWGGCPGG